MKKHRLGFKVLYMSYALVVAVVVWQRIENHVNPDRPFRLEEIPLVGIMIERGTSLSDIFHTDFSRGDKSALEIPLSVDLMKDLLSHMHQKAAPFAVLVYHGLYYITEEGYLIRPVDELSQDLPVITGSAYCVDVKKWRFAGDELFDALEFLKKIQRMHPILFAQISELYISTEYGIVAHTSLAQGIPLILGKGEMERKARYLAAFVDRMQGDTLLEDVKYMDFRVDGQIILKKNS